MPNPTGAEVERLVENLHYNLCYCSPEMVKSFLRGTIAPLVNIIADQEKQILSLAAQAAETNDLLEKALALVQIAVLTDDAWEEPQDEHSILETP